MRPNLACAEGPVCALRNGYAAIASRWQSTRPAAERGRTVLIQRGLRRHSQLGGEAVPLPDQAGSIYAHPRNDPVPPADASGPYMTVIAHDINQNPVVGLAHTGLRALDRRGIGQLAKALNFKPIGTDH